MKPPVYRTAAAVIASAWLYSAAALAQQLPSGAAPPVIEHQAVQWQIDVLQDGQPVDRFEGTTSVGQAASQTHHHPVSDAVGCHTANTQPFDLPRSVDVSPIAVDPAGDVILAIDSRQSLQEGPAGQTSAGCALPPQARIVSVRHPGLTVPFGAPVEWQLIKANPHLVFRVSARPLP